ncbi:hypothetical protein GCM10010345_92970 [Streptomyces canarius]|uniref:Uncharacterized protein n=1 Tax=Streptomyces canarius TaxID=285453 RepID=A0ABQ3DEM4_9ACTN|nr:hypothetical protein GCM10010345_92970 [Streptomyces canarius]
MPPARAVRPVGIDDHVSDVADVAGRSGPGAAVRDQPAAHAGRHGGVQHVSGVEPGAGPVFANGDVVCRGHGATAGRALPDDVGVDHLTLLRYLCEARNGGPLHVLDDRSTRSVPNVG